MDQLLTMLSKSTGVSEPSSPLAPAAAERAPSPDTALPELSNIMPSDAHGVVESGPRLPADTTAQDIALQPGTDDTPAYDITSRKVRITTPAVDGGSGFLSRKVETQEIAHYKSFWLSYMKRTLAVNNNFIAYSVKTKTGGAVRVICLENGHRALLKGQVGLPCGMPADMEFASPDSDLLATVDEFGTFVVWRLQDDFSEVKGERVLRYNTQDTSFSGFQVAWHPSNEACAFVDKNGLTLWNLQAPLQTGGSEPSVFVGDVDSTVPQDRTQLMRLMPFNSREGIMPVAGLPNGGKINDISFSRADTAGVKNSGESVAIAWSSGFVQVCECDASGALVTSRSWEPHQPGVEVTRVVFCTASACEVVDGPAAGSSHPILLTAAANNCQLALWDTRSWECLQHIAFSPAPGCPALNLSIQLTPSSDFFFVAEGERSLCYALRLDAPPAALPGQPRNYGRPRISTIDQFSLRHPVLIQAAASSDIVMDDDELTARVKMFFMMTKEVQQCTFSFPLSSADWSNSSVLVDSQSLPDGVGPLAPEVAPSIPPSTLDTSLSNLAAMLSNQSTPTAQGAFSSQASNDSTSLVSPIGPPAPLPMSPFSVNLQDLEKSLARGEESALGGVQSSDSSIPGDILQERTEATDIRMESVRATLSSMPAQPVAPANPVAQLLSQGAAAGATGGSVSAGTVDKLLAAVHNQQQQIANLTEVVTAQQRQLELLSTAVTRSESNVVSRLNRMFTQQFEAHKQQAQQERQEMIAVDREKHKRLLSAISDSFHQSLGETISASVRAETTNTVVPQVSVALAGHLQGIVANKTAEAVATTLNAHLPQQMGSQAVTQALATSVTQAVQQPVAETFKRSLAGFLPAMDASFKEMFRQIHQTFEAGTEDFVRRVSEHKGSENQGVSQAQLGQSLTQAFQARGQPAVPNLNAPNFEEAFTKALGANDLEALVTLCEKAQLPVLLQNPAALSQPVVVSLIQQLNAQLEVNPERKIDHLRAAVYALNNSDARTKAFTPKVLEAVIAKLRQIAPAAASSQHLGTNLRLIHERIMSVLKSFM